jgi:hypothetical protein
VSRPPLEVIRPAGPLAPPPDRGRLLTAEQVAAELFSGTVSPAWVRRHVPHKIVLGHSTVRWYELDVLEWIAAQRDGAA